MFNAYLSYNGETFSMFLGTFTMPYYACKMPRETFTMSTYTFTMLCGTYAMYREDLNMSCGYLPCPGKLGDLVKVYPGHATCLWGDFTIIC
jgi:hypothetical protein